MKKVLIDTSSWVEALRERGDSKVRERVIALLTEGHACWCELVRLELWNGARGSAERKILLELERDVESLKIDSKVWDLAVHLAKKARLRGKTVPSTDLLIASCARHHEADLETCDSDFEYIEEIV